jgi:hypothetical protein
VDIPVSSFYSLLYAHYTASGRKAAAYTFERSSSGDFETVIFNNAVEITKYTGSSKTINIPDRIHGLPVTAIGSYAFSSSRLMLTSVTIPNGVIVIGGTAFECNEISSVTIPDSVTAIGDNAFYANWLTSVTIPNGVTVIEDGAFSGNQLSSITIPANINVKTSTFHRNLVGVYVDGGRRAGTYITGNSGVTWSRQ